MKHTGANLTEPRLHNSGTSSKGKGSKVSGAFGGFEGPKPCPKPEWGSHPPAQMTMPRPATWWGEKGLGSGFGFLGFRVEG